MVYIQVRAVFTTYLLTTCLWIVSKQVGIKATELTTLVTQGTGTQQKTVSCLLIIHPSQCAGGCCWFTVAPSSSFFCLVVLQQFLGLAPAARPFVRRPSFTPASTMLLLGVYGAFNAMQWHIASSYNLYVRRAFKLPSVSPTFFFAFPRSCVLIQQPTLAGGSQNERRNSKKQPQNSQQQLQQQQWEMNLVREGEEILSVIIKEL